MYSVQHAACWPRPQIAAQGQAAAASSLEGRGAAGRPPPRPRRTTLLMAYNPYMPAHYFQLLCPCDSVTPRPDRGQPSFPPMRSLLGDSRCSWVHSLVIEKKIHSDYRKIGGTLDGRGLPRSRLRLTVTIVALAGARAELKFRSKNMNAFSHGDQKRSTSEAPPEAGRRTPATQLQLSS